MEAGPTFKFSNILTALISSYVLANSEGWPDIMNSYVKYKKFLIFNLIFRINTIFFMGCSSSLSG